MVYYIFCLFQSSPSALRRAASSVDKKTQKRSSVCVYIHTVYMISNMYTDTHRPETSRHVCSIAMCVIKLRKLEFCTQSVFTSIGSPYYLLLQFRLSTLQYQK